MDEDFFPTINSNFKIDDLSINDDDLEENNPNNSVTSFHELGLSRPLMRALAQMGFLKPTPIQRAAIPVALAAKDLCGGAVTGSGKTAAFVIPILERLLYRQRNVPAIRALVLLPTRELAVQCFEVIKTLCQFTDVLVCLVVGGFSYKDQQQDLRKRPDILVATPGRLVDHMKNSPSFSLDKIEILILDEADRMLEIGFQEELQEIIQECPVERQTMLFSATMSDNVEELIRLSLKNPVKLFIDSSESTASKLCQEFVRIRETKETFRSAIVLALCKESFTKKCIVFFALKSDTHRMKLVFDANGLKAKELHGDLNQKARLEALNSFKNEDVDFLLATDLASRGLDIQNVLTVINYSLPSEYKQYLHRVGRTARAGKSGRSISLVGENDRKILKLAIKNSRDQVKQRILSSETISAYQKIIQDLEPNIKTILAQEKEDKEIEKAESQLNKAGNMIQHKDEIYSRPKKVWISNKVSEKSSNNNKHPSNNNKYPSNNKRSSERPSSNKSSNNNSNKRPAKFNNKTTQNSQKFKKRS